MARAENVSFDIRFISMDADYIACSHHLASSLEEHLTVIKNDTHSQDKHYDAGRQFLT